MLVLGWRLNYSGAIVATLFKREKEKKRREVEEQEEIMEGFVEKSLKGSQTD